MSMSGNTTPLQHLFLIDVKPRQINNTPHDVYKAAGRLPAGEVEVIDLRLRPQDAELPESRSVHLFLETAGTWMCFDWDPQRFVARLDRLMARYPDCTVVGPQAQALRELTGRAFAVIDTLDFASVIAPGIADDAIALAPEWIEAARHPAYNGEHFDGERMRLAPTYSISHSMNCPLRCSFCYYADAPRSSVAGFAATMRDIELLWREGHRHFYFMDPNFLLSASQFARLSEFHARTDGRFSYFCQISPNYLSDSRIGQLAASGCRGMVVGVENAGRIVAKGSIDMARERIARVKDAGMMPMLFFIIDEDHDAEALIEAFEPVPFRFSVINHAFAGDRSLRSIEAGFARKASLAARHRDLIRRLQRKPSFLGRPAAAGADAAEAGSSDPCPRP